MTEVMTIEGLEVRYGVQIAVDGISFETNADGALCVLGPNGAGKTSCLLALGGVRQAFGGTALWRGRDVTNRGARWCIEHGIATVLEGTRTFSDLTVEENLQVPVIAVGARDGAQRAADVYEIFPRLLERRRQRAGTLSGGEQRMLAIGRGLMLRPSLLFMDEPTLGLSPAVVQVIVEATHRLQQAGIAVVVAEQNLTFAEALGGRAIVIDRGRIVWSGDSYELSTSERPRAALLGSGVLAHVT